MDTMKNDDVVLASMGQRIYAYIIDWVAVMTVIATIGWLGGTFVYASPWLLDIGGAELFMIVLLFLCMNNLAVALEVWLFNGYTLGKWMMRIRVKRLDGARITLGTALMREFILKGVINNMSQSVVNIGSLIWAVMTPECKTVHDTIAHTLVINVFPEEQ